MARADSEGDTLGFSSSNPNSKALLHFDTEQSPDDHHFAVRRILKRANLQAPPDWFESYCLTGLGHAKAWECVQRATEAAALKFGGVHSILIDGVADITADVNDAEGCNDFIASLHDLAIKHDCPIAGIIHTNPGTEKTRGHLGSQLERKAETNLRLEKEGETTVIWSDKQRRAPIPKHLGPCFQWSESAGMHVSTQTHANTRDAIRSEELRPQVADLFEERPAMRYADLKSTVMTVTRKTERTAERFIKELLRLRLVVKDVANLYTKAS
jgi:hypothetical protein